MGTPNSMAPEQARAEAVVARAGMFALGSILPSLSLRELVVVIIRSGEALKAVDGDHDR
jgi:hypothetical protein